MKYDTVIVGSGISGLYYAYLNKHKKIIIVESENRIGGRIGQTLFHNTKIVYGAGVGRLKKDILLKKILEELNVEHSIYKSRINYIVPQKINILEYLELLKQLYQPHLRSKLTFKKFLQKYMSPYEYFNFMCNTGYSDYLDADIYDTLYDYGFDDNISGNDMIQINWNDFLDKITNSIGLDKILLNKKVVKINTNQNIIHLRDGSTLQANKIILAIPPQNVYRLISKSIYRSIRSQTFCRYYVELDSQKSKDFIENITAMTYTYPPIQKIIKISETVYMISYSDNKSADKIRTLKPKELENVILSITGFPITIKDILIFYFDVGTHYFKPLSTKWKNRIQFIREAQHPYPHISVVGEALSRNQGWCEGALESVINIL